MMGAAFLCALLVGSLLSGGLNLRLLSSSPACPQPKSAVQLHLSHSRLQVGAEAWQENEGARCEKALSHFLAASASAFAAAWAALASAAASAAALCRKRVATVISTLSPLPNRRTGTFGLSHRIPHTGLKRIYARRLCPNMPASIRA